MQKGKNAPYVSAGIQGAPGVRINVRSGVHLPDSEAGQSWEPGRTPYRAEQVRAMPRGSLEVSLRAAMLIWCALFVLFGSLVIGKAVRRADISKRIDAMQADIRNTEKENEELAVQVAEARDATHICDIACQRLKMSAPTPETTQRVTAPDTRPFETENAVQADVSPRAAPDGMMTGSR